MMTLPYFCGPAGHKFDMLGEGGKVKAWTGGQAGWEMSMVEKGTYIILL